MSQEKTQPPLRLESSVDQKQPTHKNAPQDETGKREEGRKARNPNISGIRYGSWLVLSFAFTDQWGMSHWLCRCDCGKEKPVRARDLRRGTSQSCGCEGRKRSAAANTSHGKSHSPIYHVWNDILTRCRNPNFKQFHDYGGRGIQVCERWLSFENFLADMGEPPPGMFIERKDNNGNYEPGNCRWATKIEQENNKRTNRIITVDGISDTVANHARRLGVPYEKFRHKPQ